MFTDKKKTRYCQNFYEPRILRLYAHALKDCISLAMACQLVRMRKLKKRKQEKRKIPRYNAIQRTGKNYVTEVFIIANI